MAKSDLLTELKQGSAQFTLVGKAKIRDNSLKGIQQKEGRTWRHVDSSFAVDTGDNNSIFVRIWGGYNVTKPIIYKFSNGEAIQIPWEKRFEESYLEMVGFNQKLTAGLERGEDGKLIIKEFLSEIDFEDYLAENLKDGQDVRVRGDVEYSQNDETGDVYRRFNVTSVYAVEEYTDAEGVFHPIVPEATLRQTYLVDDGALERNWEKELTEKGETTMTLFVPQYLSQKKVGSEWREYKKTVAIPQAIKVKADTEDEKDVRVKVASIKRFFDVKRNKVREIALFVKVVDGYDTATGEVQVTKELQELIDLGIISQEEVQKQATVRGNRIQELIYSLPVLKKEQNGGMVLLMDDEKYAPEALIPPMLDADDSEDDEGYEEEDVTVTEDDFNDLFGLG